jgi:DNA-binding winged helix-turn-helix (wHTH) protein
MDKKESRLYEFDRFCLDASEHILLYDVQEVPLTPKVFETPLLLVENSGHVVGKEELLKTIWPDSIVEESSLSQNIFQLRKAFGDGSDGRRFIETIPKRGYKFIAPVKVVNNRVTVGDGLLHHYVTIEAALKEGSKSYTHRQEEVLIQTNLRPTSSALYLNSPSGRKTADS